MGGLFAGLIGVFVLGGLAAWTWAFVRAGDDEALRRFEFDRLSGVR